MITTTTAALPDQHVCYAVAMPDGMGKTAMYIGACKFTELATFPDAQRNSEWRRIVRPNDVITVTLWGVFPTADDAVTMRETLINSMHPHCNVIGEVSDAPTIRHSSAGQVRCIESGDVYDNAAAAARAAGVTAPAMSAHLNRKPHALTVRGYTYERITNAASPVDMAERAD